MDHVFELLPGGLRLACAPMSHMESVAVGFWTGVGGRHEPEAVCGISHFIEHMLFKGTRRRTAMQISAAVDGIGGYLNAFTGEESTCYYAKASWRHLDTLLDVLADMYRNPRMAVAEIDKERQVIKEELLAYRDAPDQHVHELLIETLWPGHPLGRLLTGTEESLAAIDRAGMLDYKQRHYTASNTVVTVAGPVNHDEVRVKLLKRLHLPPGKGRPAAEPVSHRQTCAQVRTVTRPIEQTQLAVGVRGVSRHDPRRYALRLLSVILGETMSSRLFQVVRERHGLAYAIQSSTTFFDDTGALAVSAGIDTRRMERAASLILREMTRMTERPPSEAELRRAKDYTVGQMLLGLENTTSRMTWLGEHLLAFGKVVTPEVVMQHVEAVTAVDVRNVASELFADNRLNVAIIGPRPVSAAMIGAMRFGS
jgi:predicted Zn-dependent peptidase